MGSHPCDYTPVPPKQGSDKQPITKPPQCNSSSNHPGTYHFLPSLRLESSVHQVPKIVRYESHQEEQGEQSIAGNHNRTTKRAKQK